MSTLQKTDILVLGATGFVGRLVVKFLNAHRERSTFTFTISARSKDKLETLSKELDLNAQVQVLLLDLEDIPSLEKAIKRSKVVINTVGPFWLHGTPVVRLCAQNGIHYVDITGEPVWIRKMIDKYDFLAHKTGAIILPSCGYDSIPSDLSVYLSVKSLKQKLGQDTQIGKSISVHQHRGGISFGTFSSVFSHFNDVTPKDRIAAMNPDYLSPTSRTARIPPRLVYSLPLPNSNRSIYGGIYIMGLTNQLNVYRTRGLYQICPSMKSTQYGLKFTYEEFYATSGRIRAFLLSSVLTIMALWLHKYAFARKLFKSLVVDRARGPQPEEMESGFLKLTNITESIPSNRQAKAKAKSVVRIQGDPGYLCTAECAIALLNPTTLTPLAQEGGLLTPVSALGDVLIQRLQDTGKFTFESDVISDS
ncbi:hypothetical protein Clacol_002724 [Clathrus columnatus]|uniref:Saccharopine dehydrogenase NADP binding domain-containing protein n=1 Tax=Clathrus columnatus TaxID=1419009 RepID=A0AAV5A1H9_9AGAM|nr:hypothetical protein Clacol_002724 [Clathrus columnatus]